ncbi:alginate lyase family protein [Halomonas shantousis]
MRKLTALSLGLLFTASAWAAEPRFITYPQDFLATSREAIEQRQMSLMPAYQALIDEADEALSAPLYSVTDKTQMPASGDPHDYFSFAPYWWPNPDTESGLPYVRRDGEYNMDTKSDATDKQRMIDFAKDVHALGLAYYFSGERKYADKAARQVVNWFVNDETRMNPNMRHAQAIPGRVDGRGIGIIDSRLLIGVMDAVELIRPSNALSDADYRAVKQWYGQFLDWLLTSDNGIEEGRADNNHGTWYDAQVAAFALFTDQPEIAETQLDTTRQRIAHQLDRAGKQPEELERTRPWHYVNFNLEAYTKLGRYGDKVGEDIWHYHTGKQGLKDGFQFVAAHAVSDEEWPYEELKGFKAPAALDNMLAAAHAYEDPEFFRVARRLAAKDPDALGLLLYPLQPMN